MPFNHSFNVEIIVGRSIRINDEKVDVTFKINDQAEYDSYNLTYYGTITKITEKTVTIQPRMNGRARRLRINEFCWRNYNFNLEKVIAQNSETMNYI